MGSASRAFCELFPTVYVAFCQRHDRKSKMRLTPQQDAALQHLTRSGPLTIGEMARHFARSQSAVSEIVSGLEAKGLLERMRDQRDRRRTLVWLTEGAREVLARRAEVLDPARVERAMTKLPLRQRTALVEGMRALVQAASDGAADPDHPNMPHRSRRQSHEQFNV
jgi:DNA-binding MarR family transcriptional regulator